MPAPRTERGEGKIDTCSFTPPKTKGETSGKGEYKTVAREEKKGYKCGNGRFEGGRFRPAAQGPPKSDRNQRRSKKRVRINMEEPEKR